MPPPMYKPPSVSSPPSTSRTANAKPASPSVNTIPSSELVTHDTFYEVYKAPCAGPGWRWSLWRTTDDGRALLVTMSERNKESREAAYENIEEFKKIVNNSIVRNA